MATRESSGKVLNAVAQNIPWLIGGSADLATSNKTTLKFEGAGDFQAGNYAGRNFHFGVREHAMGAALNGMSHVKLRAFGGTFFNFSDYMRPSMRLAAIMEIPTIYVFTHDSIGLGEDGPTHQPIEQLASLARHAGHDSHASRRRERSGRSLESDHAAEARAGGVGAHPTDAADARPHEVRSCFWRGQRCIRACAMRKEESRKSFS